MSNSFKAKVYADCVSILSKRILDCENGLKELQEAANDNTKSSAGDKYETGRAMVHLELEKQQKSLDNNLHLLRLLKGLDKPSSVISAGALIQTENEWFYISVSLGKIQIESETVYCISPQSPIAQQFLNSTDSKSILFMGEKRDILKVL